VTFDLPTLHLVYLSFDTSLKNESNKLLEQGVRVFLL
jgi:hypothetical protein